MFVFDTCMFELNLCRYILLELSGIFEYVLQILLSDNRVRIKYVSITLLQNYHVHIKHTLITLLQNLDSDITSLSINPISSLTYTSSFLTLISMLMK